MIINSTSATQFINEVMADFITSDLRDAIHWYAQRGVAPTKRVFMYGRYPAVSIYDKKIHIHRLLMMYYEERDLERSEYVHHIDGNPLNALPDNLEIQSAPKHQSQANKGIPHTNEHRRNAANAMCLARYGHSIYENKELLNETP